jgi:hypothetical protein
MATARPRKSKSKKSAKVVETTPVEMQISEEVWGAVNAFRQRSDHFVAEIGRIEVRKSALVDEIAAMNNKANTLLRQEGTRLGIPEGTQWRVTPEGKVVIDQGD